MKPIINNLKNILIPVLKKSKKWENAQIMEQKYWKTTRPYYMPWIERLNRFGYSLEYPNINRNFVNCIPLSTIISKFPYIKISDKPTVIDVGCGPSGIGFSIKHSGKTYCIDPLLDKYKSIHGYKENIFDKIDESKILINAAGEDFIIPEKAEIAFCINVLDHTKKPSEVLKNIFVNLKKGGFLFLIVEGYLNRMPIVIDPLHPHQFTEESLKIIVKQSGFDIKHFEIKHKIHGGRIPRTMVFLQNIGRKKKIEFCEFLVLAKKG